MSGEGHSLSNALFFMPSSPLSSEKTSSRQFVNRDYPLPTTPFFLWVPLQKRIRTPLRSSNDALPYGRRNSLLVNTGQQPIKGVAKGQEKEVVNNEGHRFGLVGTRPERAT